MADRPTGCEICGAPLPARADPRGRRRRYCSDACRKRALRRRRLIERAAEESVSLGAPIGAAKGSRASGNPIESLTRAVLNARSAAGAFVLLADDLEPALASRCTLAAARIHEALDEAFPIGGADA